LIVAASDPVCPTRRAENVSVGSSGHTSDKNYLVTVGVHHGSTSYGTAPPHPRPQDPQWNEFGSSVDRANDLHSGSMIESELALPLSLRVDSSLVRTPVNGAIYSPSAIFF